VANYASEEEKTHLQETLPARAESLSQTQRAFLHKLAHDLPGTPWEDDALQTKIFEVARMTPIDQPAAFKAIYRVLLDREAGPKAGNLLAFLDPQFVVARFRELPCDKVAFWRETAITTEAFEQFVLKEGAKIQTWTPTLMMEGNVAANEITVVMKDGKRHLKRIVVEGQPVADRPSLRSE
jgi:lysyl-tRNA synthetase class 1